MIEGERAKLDDVLDAEETAAWLKIPKSTLYKLCTEGEVPAAKVGRHWRFHRLTLEKWLLGRATKGAHVGPCEDCPHQERNDGVTD